MQAAIMDAPFKMHIGDWPTPRPGPGEVQVSVAAAGICAGDLYFYLGKNPYAVYPQACGHEIAGKVERLGEGVTGFEVGDPVVIEPFIACGRCYPCRVGKSNCCANLEIVGVHRPGGYAESVVAPAALLHKIPAGLSMTTASFAEPIAIGVQACRRGQVTGADDVLILGCGPIGLPLIEVALARGARVCATDLVSSRTEFARELGADILPPGDDLISAVQERTGGEGMPVVIEATGSTRAMEQTVELVAAGGRIVIVGLVKRGLSVALPGLDFTRKEMTIVGSRASVDCFPEALDLLASGKIRYPRVATELSLWDAPAVFAEIADQPDRYHKAVLIREMEH